MTAAISVWKASRSVFLRFAGVALAMVSLLPSAKPTQPAQASRVRTPVLKRWFQIGRASWYGHRFQGRATASGESYNMAGLTCAHRSLPLGTLIRVTNLVNHRSVVVRVNDRGPYLASRVVDLSYAAARLLRFSGTAPVRLEVLSSPMELAEAQHPFLGGGR